MAETSHLIACHECDLLHRIAEVDASHTARCTRCGAVLYQSRTNSLERSLVLTLTGLVLFVLANAFPFLTLEIEGRTQQNSLISGAIEFWRSGFWDLAIITFMMTIVLPLGSLLTMAYVLLPLRMGRRPWQLPLAFRAVDLLRPWAMMEVFMLGVLVAFVKLGDIATIVPGTSLYCFTALIIVTTAASAALDPRIVWQHLETDP